MNNMVELLARILIAAIFILAGAGKLADPAGTAGYMATAGLPGVLAMPAGLFELVAGLAVAAGFMTRPVSLLLAGFCVVTAALFHNNFADQMQMILALKNLAMAGGFLLLALHGAGPLSIDARRKG